MDWEEGWVKGEKQEGRLKWYRLCGDTNLYELDVLLIGNQQRGTDLLSTQKWVIYQGNQNIAIVIRFGVAHKASPYYRYRDGMEIGTIEWQLRVKAEVWLLVETTKGSHFHVTYQKIQNKNTTSVAMNTVLRKGDKSFLAY